MTDADLTLSALYIYPIKSAGGYAVTQTEIEPRGPQWDRRFALIGAGGRPVTQRDVPGMRLIRVQPQEGGWEVEAPGHPSLFLPERPASLSTERRHVQVWGDATEGCAVGPEFDTWFSAVLGRPVQLMQMPEDTERWQTGKPHRSRLSYVDGNPFHLITEASVAHLSAASGRALTAAEFRPNLVLSGALPPYAEDFWRRIRVGEVEFDVVESCGRCAVINVTAQGEAGAEPLRTLARTRRQPHGLPFGQHLVQAAPPEKRRGTLRVGDRVEVLGRADAPNPVYP